MRDPLRSLAVFVEDHDLRVTVDRVTRPLGLHVNVYSDVRGLLDEIEALSPAAILADSRLPEITAAELISEAQSLKIPPPVVVVADENDPAQHLLLKQGAVDVLRVPVRIEELRGAICASIELASDRCCVVAARTAIRQRLSRLTDAEHQLVDDLQSGKSNKRIAFERRIPLRTVEYRRHNAIKKLGIGSLVEAVQLFAEDRRLTDIGILLGLPWGPRSQVSQFREFEVESPQAFSAS
ncbi:MAG: response regulator, partial [Planctomycetota bacterium]